MFTGCETRSRFSAYAWDPAMGAEKPSQGRGNDELFRFKEDSNCLVRQVRASCFVRCVV